MSRKIFGPAATPAEKPTTEQVTTIAAERLNPLRVRPIMGVPDMQPGKEKQPVGAIGASLSQLSERGKHAEDIEKKLAAGHTVIQLDTALIDPSFVSDRMPLTDAALADLVETIRANTQLSPILVRPHPEKSGRYQTAFGHRRIRAAAILGIAVRAIVRDLTDEEMVIAQGQENYARKDLSYIEKARFAQRLEARFRRETIMHALTVYKSDLSNMLSVAQRIPEDLSDAIGPAPKIGRRGWIELAELLKSPKALDIARTAAAAANLRHKESDERFKAVLAAVMPSPIKSKTNSLETSRGEKLAKMVSNAQRVVVTIDRKRSPEFADFVLAHANDLLVEFEKQRRGEGT